MSRRHLARVGARLAALAALPLFGVCGPTGDTLEVFAAASLREVCGDLTPLFRARNPGVELRFDLAGSNLLAEQILASTRGGVFLSADDLQMDRIELTGRIVEGSRREFLANSLVVVVPSHEAEALARELRTPADLARDSIERLSLAHPEAVPAGRYARAWLLALGLWDDVQHKVVPALDVRAALFAVESGAAQAGICYATDAAVTDRVRVVLRAAGPEAPAVRYHAAAVQPGTSARRRSDGVERQAALDFLELLGSAEARAVFERHGFEAPAPAPVPAAAGEGPR
jgi:molybdate transport system substrate-binding protein